MHRAVSPISARSEIWMHKFHFVEARKLHEMYAKYIAVVYCDKRITVYLLRQQLPRPQRSVGPR